MIKHFFYCPANNNRVISLITSTAQGSFGGGTPVEACGGDSSGSAETRWHGMRLRRGQRQRSG